MDKPVDQAAQSLAQAAGAAMFARDRASQSLGMTLRVGGEVVATKNDH